MCHGISLPTTWLVKPKKAEDEQDDDHKADEIDNAVHGVVTSRVTIHQRIVRVQTKSVRKTTLHSEMFRASDSKFRKIGD
jgi:hypothetical protein